MQFVSEDLLRLVKEGGIGGELYIEERVNIIVSHVSQDRFHVRLTSRGDDRYLYFSNNVVQHNGIPRMVLL